MYRLSIDTHFSAAHALRGYPGDCARLHGHTWGVTATIGVEVLDETGIGFDFKDVARILEGIVGRYDHRTLNDLDEFTEVNPTAEHISRFIYGALCDALKDVPVRVLAVTVAESDRYRVTYTEDDNAG